jgi:predicted transcriptional regulator
MRISIYKKFLGEYILTEGVEKLLSQLADSRDYCEKQGLDFAAYIIDIAIEDLCDKIPVDNEQKER